MKPLQRIKRSGVLSAAVIFVGSGTVVLAQEMPTQSEPGASIPTASGTENEELPVREIRLLPSQKRSLVVKTEEHNPYARRTPEITVNKTESDEETEFDKIRRVLMGLQVSGRVYGPKGIRLLAGNIILEAGREVPPVVLEQTERLFVENVTENEFTIIWIDPETNEPTERRLTLDYDLSVKVRYVLAGQTITEGSETKDLKYGLVTRKRELGTEGEESESEQRTRATASRFPNGVSEEVFKQGQ